MKAATVLLAATKRNGIKVWVLWHEMENVLSLQQAKLMEPLTLKPGTALEFSLHKYILDLQGFNNIYIESYRGGMNITLKW